MGKKAAFAKARFQGIRQQKRQREQRSVDERVKRRGVDEGGRLIQRVTIQKELPTQEEEEILLRQIPQACRLPLPSKQLCALIRSYGEKDELVSNAPGVVSGGMPKKGEEKKRMEHKKEHLQAIVTALTQTQSIPAAGDNRGGLEGDEGENAEAEENDPVTIFHEIMQDECSCSVLSTLLSVLHTSGSPALQELLKTIVDHFEEEENLIAHHAACKLASSVVEFGDSTMHTRILNIFQQRGSTIDDLQRLLTDRHTARTIERMIRCNTKETVQWLCEGLGLKHRKENAKKKISEMAKELIWKLIDGPVSGQVMQALITPETRSMFLQHVSVSKLSSSKRGVSFLSALLSTDREKDIAGHHANSADTVSEKSGWALSEPDAHALVSQLVGELLPQMKEMCVDKRANFVMQRIFHLITLSGKHAEEHFLDVYSELEESLQSIASDGIGVHVIIFLIDAAGNKCINVVEKIGATLINKSNVKDMLMSKHESQVIRKLIQYCVAKKASSATGKLLESAIDQNMDLLLFHEYGNLAVQDYLKAAGCTPSFLRCLKADALFRMCQNQYASRVIYSVFDVADSATLTALCNALKASAPLLSRHLNGRFIIEKAIASSREIRDVLVYEFKALAFEQGAQHVLCALMMHIDPHGKRKLINNVIVPALESMAIHQYASIALQKLMQQEPALLEAIQIKLKGNEKMKNELAQNFFGKFVIQIAQQKGA